MNTLTECIYCNTEVPDEGEYVPEVNDYSEWARLALLHGEDCEWVMSRAHRLDPDEECACEHRRDQHHNWSLECLELTLNRQAKCSCGSFLSTRGS